MNFSFSCWATISKWNVRCRQFKLRAKLLFCLFLHHSIEFQLLITNIYFLALAKTSFWSKNTKYSQGVVFQEKCILSRNVQSFLLCCLFHLHKIMFLDSASKTEYRQVVKSTPELKIFCGGASNRVECTTYRSIL